MPSWPGVSVPNDAQGYGSPVPLNPVNIPGGGVQNYTWTFQATATGSVTFTMSASGTDANSNSAITSNVATTSPPVNIVSATYLIASISDSQAVISTGNVLTVWLTVTNTGQAAANNAAPNPAVITGAAGYTPITTPVASTIPGGGSVTFTWTYSMTGAGLFNFQTYAKGTDANSGVIVNSSPSNNIIATVQQAAALASSISLSPVFAGVGWQVTVYMTVTNTGGAAANNVSPQLTPVLLGGGNVTLTTPPSPFTVSIGAGLSNVFTWIYSTNSTGTINFSGYASGQDINSNNNIASPFNYALLYIQTPAALSSAISIIPATLSSGQLFTVIMTVTNTGLAAANVVTPTTLTKYGSGGTYLNSGPQPLSTSIPGGATAYFTWTYMATGLGSVAFSGGAHGWDNLTGANINSIWTISNMSMIVAGAQLASSITVAPASVNLNNTVTVIMTVSNGGTASCVNVTPVLINEGWSGTGGVALLSGPSPASQAVPGLGMSYFTWTYQSVGVGTVIFSAEAQGNDQNTGNQITSNFASSNTLAIQTRAILTVAASVFPTIVDTGQKITLIMTVTNSGQGSANSTVGVGPGMQGSGTVLLFGSPPPAVTITAGSSAYFTWIYTAETQGNITFTMSARGIDNNSQTVVTSNADTTTAVNIQNAPNLTCNITANPLTVDLTSQLITVVVNINNSGGAMVNNVLPNIIVIGGSPTPVSTPQPANIPGQNSQSFTYTYMPSAAGTLVFSGNASGTDANNGSTVNSTYNNSSTVTVQTTAALSAAITGIPSIIASGQTLTLYMTVTNAGQETANNTIPLPVGVNSIFGGASATKLTGPLPASYTIPGNSSATFTWTYQMTGVGTVQFTGSAQWVDADSSVNASSLSASSNFISVMTPSPILASSMSISNNVLSVSEQITVIMTVTNSGVSSGCTHPSAMNIIGGAESLISGPLPAYVTITALGGVADFTWTYSAANAGVIQFSASAYAYEGNGSTTTAVSQNLTIQTVPALLISFTALPVSVDVGQAFTVIMTVSNTGQATATGIVPAQYGSDWLLNLAPGPHHWFQAHCPVHRQ